MRLLIISVLIGVALDVVPLSAQMSGDLPLTKEQIDQLDSSAKTIEQIGQLRQNVDSLLSCSTNSLRTGSWQYSVL